jgi:hypothetical protein
VLFQEFEFDPDGDFAKVHTYYHRLGVAAEYEWIRIKYPNYMFVKQTLTHITLNGENIPCDILTIWQNGQIKKIYFDISQMMETPHWENPNKDHWENKAKVIHEKLIRDYGFTVDTNNEGCLFKKIHDEYSIAFDVSYFFGLICPEDIPPDLRKKLKNTIGKYKDKGFITNLVNTNDLVGGCIRIDTFDDIDIVFSNFEALEKETRELIERIDD